MAAYLDQHPDIYFTERKEPFFFSSDLPHTKAVTDEDAYLDLFKGGAGHRYRGEGSTWYLYSKRAATAISEVCPEARIIIMLRDPIDLILSQFQYNLINGNENIEDIERALDTEPERLAGRLLPKSNRIAAALHYTEMVNFAPQVKRYLDLFGRDQVHVILFQDLKDDAEACVRRVFDFLDVRAGTQLDLTPENETAKQTTRRFGGLYRTMITKKGLMGQAKRIVPEPIKAGLWGVLDRMNRAGGQKPSKPSLSPALRQALSDKLRPGIDQLSELLDTDLSGWARPEPVSPSRDRYAMRA